MKCGMNLLLWTGELKRHGEAGLTSSVEDAVEDLIARLPDRRAVGGAVSP